MHIKFEWDEAKRRANVRKHGVDFAEMTRFDWSTHTSRPDARRTYGEERLCLLGLIDGRIHAVVVTRRRDRLRIISLRKANRREVSEWTTGSNRASSGSS
jgi:uncharacterized DUF497 family protein